MLCCMHTVDKTEYPQRSQPTGTWQWINSVGGIAGHMTPETAGYTQTMVLTENDMYKLYRDDSLVVLGVYSYIYDRGLLIIRAQSQFEYSITITDDTLKMDMINILDGYSHTYIRSR